MSTPDNNTTEWRMEPGLNDLRRQLHFTDIYEVLSSRRAGPNEIGRIMHLIPYPTGIDVKNPLPEWTRIPLCSKIPFVKAPQDFVVYTRGKLGETVRRQGDTFDLTDPHNYALRMEYEAIHDKHLRHYFFSPGNKKILDAMGMLTKDDEVKCDLKEYNAYRRYVYNVHKNSVLKALREVEEIKNDKALARFFLADALDTRRRQFVKEAYEKDALRRASYRRLLQICERLLCNQRLKRLERVQEKKTKQKERHAIKLLVSQKNFQESLQNYRRKSHDIAWKRNIRAQKKWRKAGESKAYRKLVNEQLDHINKLVEVIEYWIKKEVQQIASREKDTKIWQAFKKFSDQRKAARENNFLSIELKNLARLDEIKHYGPTPRRELEKKEHYDSVGSILAGWKQLKPSLETTKYTKPMFQQVIKNVVESGNPLAVKYLGTNIMRSRMTTEVMNNILECIYRRTMKTYLRSTVYKYFPIVITELKHVVALFEESMKRKKSTVDEIRRFVRSYVGHNKCTMFDQPDYYTSCGYIGKLKKSIYRSTIRGQCKCYPETCSDSSKRKVKLDPHPTSMVIEPKNDKKVSFQKEKLEVATSKVKTTQRVVNKVSSTPGKQAAKGKSKEPVQPVSILKGCPLKSYLEETSKSSLVADQDSCCPMPFDQICDCNRGVVCNCLRKVNNVRFNVADSLSDDSGAEKESIKDKIGKSVTFGDKPIVHNYSIDIPDSENVNKIQRDSMLNASSNSIYHALKAYAEKELQFDQEGGSQETGGQQKLPSVSSLLELFVALQVGAESSPETAGKKIKDNDKKLLYSEIANQLSRAESKVLTSPSGTEQHHSFDLEQDIKEVLNKMFVTPVDESVKKTSLKDFRFQKENNEDKEEVKKPKKTQSFKTEKIEPEIKSSSCCTKAQSKCFEKKKPTQESIRAFVREKFNAKKKFVDVSSSETSLKEILSTSSSSSDSTSTEENLTENIPKININPTQKVEKNKKNVNLPEVRGLNELDGSKGKTLANDGVNKKDGRRLFEKSNKKFDHFNKTERSLKTLVNDLSNNDNIIGRKDSNDGNRNRRFSVDKNQNAGLNKPCEPINLNEEDEKFFGKFTFERKPVFKEINLCPFDKSLFGEREKRCPPIIKKYDYDIGKLEKEYVYGTKAVKKNEQEKTEPDVDDANKTVDKSSSEELNKSAGDANNKAKKIVSLETTKIQDEVVEILAQPKVIPSNTEATVRNRCDDLLEAKEQEQPVLQQAYYSSGSTPRGVRFKQTRIKTKSTTVDSRTSLPVLMHYPKSTNTPRFGHLEILKQVFEPNYTPTYCSDPVKVNDEEDKPIKSILKKTEYSAAENSSLVPKFLAHYKFQDVNELKNYVILRTCFNTREALAAAKLDYEKEDLTVAKTRLKSRCKEKRPWKTEEDQVNLDDLGRYTYQALSAGSETYKKFINSSHSVVKSEVSVPLLTNVHDDADAFVERIERSEELNKDFFDKNLQQELLPAVTKLITEAVPEVSEVYNEFFSRGQASTRTEMALSRPFLKNHNKDELTRTTTGEKMSKSGVDKKRFNSPEDVIIASMKVTGNNIPKVITSKAQTTTQNKTKHASKQDQYETQESHYMDSSSFIEVLGNTIVGSDISTSSESEESVDYSSTSSLPSKPQIVQEFKLLSNLKPKDVKLCDMCQVCCHDGGNKAAAEDPKDAADLFKDLLQCKDCGTCVHQIMREKPNPQRPESPPSKNTDQKEIQKPAKENQDHPEEGGGDIKYMNNKEVRKYYFKKQKDYTKSYANLKAIFGRDFSPEKFVYFVNKDNNDYIRWKDLRKMRYPVRPFPWNKVKLERLRKRKLPINDIKEYKRPDEIFQKKAAKGFGKWESSRTAETEDGKTELKFNSVPQKYEKYFSTTHKPVNRPARQFKSVKTRPPTPMPSVTDLVTRILDETRGDLYETITITKHEQLVFNIMKTKLESTVRVMMNIVVSMCILKLKEGYPRLKKMLSKNTRNYFYIPKENDKYSARKLVTSLSEFLLWHDIHSMHFSKLEPLVDILLKYIVRPDKYPLIFPQDASELLLDSDEEESVCNEEEKKPSSSPDVREISKASQ